MLSGGTSGDPEECLALDGRHRSQSIRVASKSPAGILRSDTYHHTCSMGGTVYKARRLGRRSGAGRRRSAGGKPPPVYMTAVVEQGRRQMGGYVQDDNRQPTAAHGGGYVNPSSLNDAYD